MNADRSRLTQISGNKLVHEEISKSIIGCAMTVVNRLGCGLPEKVYERALIIELRKRGHTIDQQKEFEIYYDGIRVGSLIPDLIVDDRVIVDTKVVSAFADEHISKMLSYLVVTDLQLALLVNFFRARLQWKRVVARSASV